MAALAAKRRQKESEKQDSQKPDDNGLVEPAASGLAKLRLPANSAAVPTNRPSDFRQKRLGQQPGDAMRTPSPLESLEIPKGQAGEEVANAGQEVSPTPCEVDLELLQASPSPFAQTLLVKHQSRLFLDSVSSSPLSCPPVSAYNFSKPSPDDAVLKARSCKGPP